MKIVTYLHEVVEMAHLDIKPDNIILKDDGSLALIDFSYVF